MRLESGAMFADGKPRYIGWHKLPDYPFIAMVGVSEAEVMAPYRATERGYRLFAWMGTLVLFAFGMASALLMARLSARTRQIEAVRQTYRLATEGANEGFYMLKPVRDGIDVVDFDIVDCNERGAAMYGSVRENLLGSRLSTLHPEEDFPALLEAAAAATRDGFQEAEVPVPPQARMQALWLHRRLAATNAGLAMTVCDISERRLHQQQLLRMANQDPLTGLQNRQWLNDALPAAIERTRKRGGMLGLLFIDLDRFKQVNDSAGHHVGDELLRIVAQRMKAALRPGDHVARLGGDEFTVILEALESEEDASQAARRIGRCLSEPYLIRDAQYSIGASTGIALFPRDGEDAERLLQNADVAMYAAKAEGRGGEQRFQAPMGAQAAHDAAGDAPERGQLFLRFQPLVDIGSGALKALEAQLCWHHPWRGPLSPEQVHAHAETADAVPAFGDSALDLACESLAHWHDSGLPQVTLALRLPARYLNREGAHNAIAACLMRHGVHCGWLEIGVDQSAHGLNDTGAAEMAALAAMGMRFLLEDSGALPMAQLERLPVRSLKLRLDAFTALGREPAVLDALAGMTQRMGIGLIVAGVDSAAQRARLTGLAGVLVQGDAFEAPLSAEAVPALLQARLGQRGAHAAAAHIGEAGRVNIH
jgi:diguanylate cyclase (GGDEF)-like protein